MYSPVARVPATSRPSSTKYIDEAVSGDDTERRKRLESLIGDDELVEAHRSMILDPHDPAVIEAAKRCGIPDGVIESAQKSPVYRFAKEWKIGLPLHVEYRTFPMLFYVPPLLPVMSISEGDLVRSDVDDLFADIEKKYIGETFRLGLGDDGLPRIDTVHIVAAFFKSGE